MSTEPRVSDATLRAWEEVDRLKRALADRDAEIVALREQAVHDNDECIALREDHRLLSEHLQALNTAALSRDAEIVRLREWVTRFRLNKPSLYSVLGPQCVECRMVGWNGTAEPEHSPTCSVPSLLSPSPQGASEK